MKILNLTRTFLLSAAVFTSLASSGQIVSPNGDNIFYYNGAADVTFRFAERGQGGRAIVHDFGNILTLNYGGDFTGGTKFGTGTFFKDGGISYISSSKFGIGTTTPDAQLTVYGESRVYPKMVGGQDARSLSFTTSLANNSFVSNNYPLVISTGGGDQPLALDAARIGIGTTNPGYKFTVASGDVKAYNFDNNSGISIGAEASESPRIGFHVSDNSRRFKLQVNQINSNYERISFSSTNGGYWSEEQEIFAINKAGRIGIGTPQPEELLELRSSSPIQTFHQPGVASYKVGVSDGLFKIAAMDNGYGGNTGNFNNNKSQVISMIANGNVGIGTSTPDAKLSVKGKIHAEEVKIDLNVPAPDYVFESNYDLKSLKEVEKYISANKHLPEIPSAKEIKENGVEMGEMQMKLLQKIEELTLHLIEQKKEIDTLKKQMAEVNKK